jgi:Tol biopolymer transport system component
MRREGMKAVFRVRSRRAGVLAVIGALAAASAALAASPTTERVSVTPTGAGGNGSSYEPPMSADGRFVVFSSEASNLVDGDTNHSLDVFIRDRQTGQTTLASVSSSGAQANGDSYRPAISGDGRFVGFTSHASNLAPVDRQHAYYDVFVHDRQTGATTLVSEGPSGAPGNGESNHPSLSENGRFVAFSSDADNLVPGKTVHPAHHEFVRDMQTGKIERIDVSSKGVQGDGDCHDPSISADGRFDAFTSRASNLVKGDTNHAYDVFVRDRKLGKTTRVSVSSTGQQANESSIHAWISGDGRYVTFESKATNLTPHDTNRASDIFIHDRKTGKTQLVSVGASGKGGNADSVMPSTTNHGGWVAFYSEASNLVPGDTNGVSDAFVRDLRAGTTTRVSVDSAGAEANARSTEEPPVPPEISADGRFVAFTSDASNLVAPDANHVSDVFVRGPLR